MTGTLTLQVLDEGRELSFAPRQLVIGGYTGVDEDRVEEHIRELASEGIPPPETIPMFYDVDPELLVTDEGEIVAPARSCGEVEPVLLDTPEGRFIGVGSDHTDRELERSDILASKRACAKVLGRHVLTAAYVEQRWESAVLRSWAHGDGEPTLYQDGRASDLRRPGDLLALLRERMETRDGSFALFLGTVPLIGGAFRISPEFHGEFAVPGAQPLTVRYRMSHRSAE